MGGWRGGKVFADNSFEDWDLLHSLLIKTVQNTTLAFHDALAASVAGPVRADLCSGGRCAHGRERGLCRREGCGRNLDDGDGGQFREVAGRTTQHSAAVVLRVKALLTPAMREAKPDAAFAGFTTVEDLAVSIADLWSQDAAVVNGKRISA